MVNHLKYRHLKIESDPNFIYLDKRNEINEG